MGKFDRFVDTPNAIRTEGLDIELQFQRTSDTTGIVSWNIPAPSAGCNSTNQAYNGIVITVASSPADYLTTSPVDGTFYTADPSVDPDLNTGSKLNGAMVVGAFYDNKTITALNVTDLKPLTAYYFSAYAVDNVCRYHREGVHAYSIPSGADEPNGEVALPAVADVGIETDAGLDPDSFTGLKQSGTYAITCIINGVKYHLNISGTLALDYDDLIYAINQEFIRVTDGKYVSPYPPNANSYYIDVANSKAYRFDGTKNTFVDILFSPYDPSTPTNGTLWYNTTAKQLNIYNSGWVPKTFIASNFDFANPLEYQYWFDGTNVYKWEKVLWCQMPTYVQDINPLIPPALDSASFWYNTSTNLVSQWDIKLHAWNSVYPIYADVDPNNITSGAYWYNQVDTNVYYYAGGTWHQLHNVTFADPNIDGSFPGIAIANIYWFKPGTQTLFRRDASNSVWVQMDVILYVADPTDRDSCQLWWNSTANTMNIWDTVNARWIAASQFYEQAVDPATPPTIPLNSAWYNSTTKVLTIINNPDCTVADVVYSATDPTVVTFGSVWYNPVTNVWSQWNGSGWSVVSVIEEDFDPYHLSSGTLWFNSAAQQLNIWDGLQFSMETFSLSPFVPTVGELWLNPVTELLYEWNGTAWVQTIGVAAAQLILRSSYNCAACKSPVYTMDTFDSGYPLQMPMDTIRFYTKATGCNQKIQLCFDDGAAFVFANLQQNVQYLVPQPGYSPIGSGPSYKTLGVGDDGSPDERRAMDATIRTMLGSDVMTVELSKNAIDVCINNALMSLRKNSDLGYKRGFFFLDVFPRQQTYYLKDKCVGFNKITQVTSIYRTNFSLGGGNQIGGDSVFAYGMLQGLYNSATFDILTYHLVGSYLKELSYLFANNIMFLFDEKTRGLKMFQTFYSPERVLVDAMIERTEQELLTNRETCWWLQRWAVAEAKMILAQARGKYQNLAGPNGNTTLNAGELIAQAQQEMQALEEEIHNMINQDLPSVGMRGVMLIG